MTEGKFEGMEEVGYKRSDFDRDPESLDPEEYHDEIDRKLETEELIDRGDVEFEKQKTELLRRLQEENVALKVEALHKAPKMGNLIDLFSEMADELIATDERAKAQIIDEYAIELQRKIEAIANNRQKIEEVIEALETTYLDQMKNQYLHTRKDEEEFERTHPDDHWTAESQAAKEVQNKRIAAYENYKEAQNMVEEIVPVLRAIAERLS